MGKRICKDCVYKIWCEKRGVHKQIVEQTANNCDGTMYKKSENIGKSSLCAQNFKCGVVVCT